MGTVKYTGPVASFHCPTEATIRSLKVHFSPKQEGSGDPSPENVRPIVGWNGVVVHNDDGNVVPEEYQKVKYLEGLGNQYLVTNIPIKESITIETVQIFTSNSDQYMIGAAYDENGTAYRSSANGTYRDAVQGAYSGYFIVGSVSINSKYHIKTTLTKGSQIVIVDDIQVGSLTRAYANAFDETKANYGIFCQYKTGIGAQFIGKAKLYSAKVYYENNVFGNFIPCRRKSDNKPGMYDTVTQTFFTNQGTGEFVCGPDVGQTTEYEFGVLGKNKFNYSDAIVGKYIRAVSQGDNKPIGAYVDNAPSWTCSDFIAVIPKQQYTLTIPSYKSASVSGIVFYSTNEIGAEIGGVAEVNFTNTGTNNPATYTFTCQDNCHYIKFSYNNTSGNEAQLELGSSPTTYEPYNPNHTVYGGWVDLITGEVCETHIREGLTSVNQEALSAQYNTAQTVFFRCNTLYQFALTKETAGGDIVDRMCEIFTYGTNWGSGDSQDEGVNRYCRRYNSGQAVCIRMYNSVFGIDAEDTVEVKKEKINVWLSSHPIYISYKMREPITYHLAPTSMQTFLAQNNVWSNADYVEVEHDLHETQNILARKQFIMANQPHIVKPAAAPLQNFVTDMKAPLKECKVHFSPVQEGTGDPSPTNIRPISGWTTATLNRSNENLWDNSYYSPLTLITDPENTYYGFYAGSIRSWGSYYKGYGRISVTAEYGCDQNAAAGRFIFRVYFRYSDGTVEFTNNISANAGEKLVYTRTSIEGKTCVAFRITTSAGTGNTNGRIRNVMVTPYGADTTYIEPNHQIYPITLPSEAGMVYGGTLDVTNGTLTVTHGQIASYNGETLSGAWISDRDVYAEGATPTIGAQVVYELDTPQTYELTPVEVKTLRGTNNVWSNSNGNLEIAYWKH